jgi:DNA mismatch repair protein MutS
MISKVFSRFLVSLYNINKDIEKICNFIGEIDIVTTNAFNAIKYKYCRPSISKIATKSFVKAKGIRHAIIEMIQNKTEYVCNDISLGCKGCDGLLLYGINASGKSSLMKSVGISVIMASAGMYVPCEEFEFYPYDSIFTRIPTGDNMFKGESTFTNEISELRKIIQYANRNSLVIGDELCSGTESVSAMSIVASGILELCYRGTSFIFATHLHDLVNLNKVKTLDNLRVCHLKVTYDEKTNSLIYDRKLADGQGATLYGLEVCKSLNLPKSFLETADSIRKEIMEMSPTLLGYKRSRYNNSLFKDKCGLCDTEKVEEVHHIVEQHTADENGFVDHRHKNHLSNLVGLCKECHQKVHDGIIKINGYKQTSSGIRLMYGVENF